VLQLSFSVPSALISAWLIHKYSPSPNEGGVSDHPLGFLVVEEMVGAVSALLFFAYLKSV
jgi:hypothetical protein